MNAIRRLVLATGLLGAALAITGAFAAQSLAAGAVGSSLIIHANEDDQVTNATNGNSGGRIACGVITAG